jgi:hypothetical protein
MAIPVTVAENLEEDANHPSSIQGPAQTAMKLSLIVRCLVQE